MVEASRDRRVGIVHDQRKGSYAFWRTAPGQRGRAVMPAAIGRHERRRYDAARGNVGTLKFHGAGGGHQQQAGQRYGASHVGMVSWRDHDGGWALRGVNPRTPPEPEGSNGKRALTGAVSYLALVVASLDSKRCSRLHFMPPPVHSWARSSRSPFITLSSCARRWRAFTIWSPSTMA